VSSIKPEYLMEPYDYKVWLAMQKETENEKIKEGIIDTRMLTADEQEIEDQLFEAVSKRAWTDMLLQILKVRGQSKKIACVADPNHCLEAQDHWAFLRVVNLPSQYGI
jgi:hypothetical protein